MNEYLALALSAVLLAFGSVAIISLYFIIMNWMAKRK